MKPGDKLICINDNLLDKGETYYFDHDDIWDEKYVFVKDKNNMMYDFFYMFAKTKIPNMPVRTGYVYGYLKVKEYMRKNNLKIKDIVKLDWREVLNG